MEEYHFNGEELQLDALAEVIKSKTQVKLGPQAIERIQKCRSYLDQRLAKQPDPIYGINTGFGALYNTSIATEDLGKLQRNLVLSHACGTGETVPQSVVRWMMLLKIASLAQGHSGVQLKTVQRLIDLYNNNLLPVIYEQGSLGASGDLAPLAHLSLPLIGEGQLWVENAPKPTKEIYWSLGWESIELQSKEGLALLNGTQFMGAYGCYLVQKAKQLLEWSDAIAAMSLEAFDGRPEPFGASLNAVRNQQGQIKVAENMRSWLDGSKGISRLKVHVQDPYSFRCIPQVHGASRDALEYVERVFARELNAVTDNPTIFPEEDLIVSGGNFHGQPLAIALDFFAIALAELGSISERRTYKLLSGQRGLPAFLTPNPGLNSGFMIPQYTAASIVSQNKQLCTPASVDSIDSSNGQEDHVSMGANAATKAYRVLLNVRRIMAIELFTAAQALELRGIDDTSPQLQEIHRKLRKQVPFLPNDEYLHPLMRKCVTFLSTEGASI
jgi:histidine ammonia-lyase